MDISTLIMLAALGACTGFLAGLLGIGGGMVLTPFLTMILAGNVVPNEVGVHVAIATSLATIVFTSASSVRAHNARGAVLWNIVLAGAPGILLGALLGAQISGLLSNWAISLLFGCFVMFSALRMFFGKKGKATRELPGKVGIVLGGGIVGSVSSLVGAGGGFISVPLMTACNVPIHKAVGTSAALGFPIAFAGSIGYIISGWNVPGMPEYSLGFLYLPALFSVAAFSVLTAPLGAKLAHSMDTKPLKRIFASLLFVLSAYMLLRALTAL